MKRLLLIILPLLLMVGCEDKKDDAGDSNPIIGDWTILSQTNDCELFFEVGNTILFSSDGTFTLERTDNSYGTNWSLTENTLTMEFECGDCPLSMTWSLEIGENTTKLKNTMIVNEDGTEYNSWACTLTLIKS